MFKVKTTWICAVEKDKIESIIPSTPAGKPEAASTGKKDASQHPSKPAANFAATGGASGRIISDASAAATTLQRKTVSRARQGNRQAPPKITNAAVKPEVPTSRQRQRCGLSKDLGATTLACHQLRASPAPPKEPEVPAKPRRYPGQSLYELHSRLSHVQSTKLELDSRKRAATSERDRGMGTFNESTLWWSARRRRKNHWMRRPRRLDEALHEVYANTSDYGAQTVVGGYQRWSINIGGRPTTTIGREAGRCARGKDMFTVLAMTYADQRPHSDSET